MNPNCCATKYTKTKQDTLNDLQKEYESIKRDMRIIKEMEISDEARKLPLKELQEQINDVKERMHDVIDMM